jgi:F-type H+-transporting ATPase subunit b
MLDKAKATQAAADAEMAKATQVREGLTAERAALLDAAKAEAEAATAAALASAASRAEDMQIAAKASIEHDRAEAAKANAEQSVKLSLQIAAKLLARLNGPIVQNAFLDLLVQAIAKLPEPERTALANSAEGIEIVIASTDDTDSKVIKAAIHKALGAKPDLRLVADPALLAGIELRTAHFTLHNSWRADLSQIEKAVHDAA